MTYTIAQRGQTTLLPLLLMRSTSTAAPLFVPAAAARTDTEPEVEERDPKQDWYWKSAWPGVIEEALQEKERGGLPRFETVDDLISYLNREQG